MSKFKIGDQVTVRESIRGPMGGNGVVSVRLAEILAFRNDGKEAEISIFSANPSVSRAGSGSNRALSDIQKVRKWVPVEKLETSSDRFGGRKVVQIDPISRSIGSLIKG